MLNDEVGVGDVVVAYQTDDRVVVGFLRVERISGPRDSKKLYLCPIHRLDQPLAIHDRKVGTLLAYSKAVNGPVMLRELDAAEMSEVTRLSGAPQRVLRGQEPAGGYRPGGSQQST